MNIVLSRLKEISSAIMYAAEAVELEEVLQRIADVAREIAETRYAALGIPDGDGGLRFFKVSGMSDEEIALIDHLPLGKGLIMEPMRRRESLIVPDMSQHPRSYGFPDNHPPMTALLGVPVQMGRQLFGVLYLTDKIDGSPFNDADKLLIETLASYAALVIASVELRQQRNRLSLLEERERIGMELHDGIIQSLYGIGMQVELLRGDEPVPGEELVPIVSSLNQVIDDIRAYIQELRQRGERHLTTREHMEHLVQRLHVPRSLETIIDAPDSPPPFTPAVTESIWLIANEAVSNAIRHSGASRLELSAAQVNGTFVIGVIDDGSGFDLASVREKSAGLGLRNMQQRARLYGGEVRINSAPGNGTELYIYIPVRIY